MTLQHDITAFLHDHPDKHIDISRILSNGGYECSITNSYASIMSTQNGQTPTIAVNNAIDHLRPSAQPSHQPPYTEHLPAAMSTHRGEMGRTAPCRAIRQNNEIYCDLCDMRWSFGEDAPCR